MMVVTTPSGYSRFTSHATSWPCHVPASMSGASHRNSDETHQTLQQGHQALAHAGRRSLAAVAERACRPLLPARHAARAVLGRSWSAGRVCTTSSVVASVGLAVVGRHRLGSSLAASCVVMSFATTNHALKRRQENSPVVNAPACHPGKGHRCRGGSPPFGITCTSLAGCAHPAGDSGQGGSVFYLRNNCHQRRKTVFLRWVIDVSTASGGL